MTPIKHDVLTGLSQYKFEMYQDKLAS